MILVGYASKHGATQGIAEAIAARLVEDGHEAVARPVGEVATLEGVDALLLGSAIYAGSWMKEAVEFATANAQHAADIPVWLFSSGPLGEQVVDDEEQPRQMPDLREALHPREHKVFFGALDREKLGFGERMIVKAVKAPEGDFRDWDEIRTWTDGVAAALD
jgi:menaquinone-dependent protoporphyrinogen oxidase